MDPKSRQKTWRNKTENRLWLTFYENERKWIKLRNLVNSQ